MPLSKRMMGYSKKSVQAATSLGNLNDVSISSVSDNEVITYDSGTGKWTNTPEAGGGGPGGSTTYMQYNNGGSFGGISTFTFDGSDINLTGGNFNIVPAVGTSTLKITGSLEVSGTGGDDIILRNDDDTNPKTVFIKNILDNASIKFEPSGGGAPTYVTTSGNFWGVGPSHTWGSNEHLTFDLANTRLGIGTDSPAYPLDVAGAIQTNQDYYLKRTGGAFYYQNNGGTNLWAIYEGDGDLSIWDYQGGGGETVTFQAGGNVGIGTGSPEEKLQVAGHIRIDNGTNDNRLIFDNHSTVFTSDSTDSGMQMRSWGGASYTYPIKWVGVSGASNYHNISFLDDFVMISGSKVGIGTTEPTQTLDVVGDFSLGSSVTLIENATPGTISGTAFQYGTSESTYITDVAGNITSAALILTSANYWYVKPDLTSGGAPAAITTTLPDGSAETGIKVTISQRVDGNPEAALSVAPQGSDVIYEGASNSASATVAIPSFRGANKTFLTIAAGVWVVID